MNFPTTSNVKRNRLISALLLALTILFFFLTGVSITALESPGKYIMGLVLFPLLIVLLYILLQKIRTDGFTRENSTETNAGQGRILRWNEKTYAFSKKSIILFLIGAPLLSSLLYLFFLLDFNIWTQEIVAKQTQFLLNVFFRIPSQVTFHPGETFPWKISVAGAESPFGISLLCTGIQVFCIFAGIITFIPHSQTPLTRKDILWRKTKTLVVVIALIYIINLFRLVFLLYLTYIGIDWQMAHLTLLYVSTAIGAVLFFFLLYRWVPELFIALYSLPSVLR